MIRFWVKEVLGSILRTARVRHSRSSVSRDVTHHLMNQPSPAETIRLGNVVVCFFMNGTAPRSNEVAVRTPHRSEPQEDRERTREPDRRQFRLDKSLFNPRTAVVRVLLELHIWRPFAVSCIDPHLLGTNLRKPVVITLAPLHSRLS